MSGYNYKICELPSPELTTVSGYCDYEVNIGSITAYRGRAYGSPTVKIPLARIVEGYLGAEHLDIAASGLTLESELDGWMEVELIQFYPDGTEEIVYYGALRSYDYVWNWDGESCTLSEPVNGRIDSRMQLLYSVYRKTTEEDIEIGIVPVVVIVPMQINVPAMDTTSYFTVQSNVPYVVTCSWDWLDAEQDSEDPNKWIISVDENTGNTRTASVEVRYQDERGNNVQQTVYVTQAEPIFEVVPQSLVFTPDAATQYITVNSNIKFNVQAGDEWLTVSPVSGASGTTIIAVSAEQYDEPTDRGSSVEVGNITVDVNQKALNISVEPSSLAFLPAGGSATVEVTANGAYTVSSNRYWAVPSVSAGTSGTTTITISVDEYTGTSANRGATITIGNQTLSISQEKKVITVTPASKIFESPIATGYTISVEANVPWTGHTSSGWISFSPNTGATGITEVAVNIADNQSSARVGEIGFWNGTYSSIAQVMQTALEITLSQSTVTAPVAASSLTVDITANGNYDISTNDSWITLSTSSGTSGTTTLVISVEANSGAARSGSISVGNKQISVSQEALEITLSTSAVTAIAAATAATVDITANGDYSISTADSWITLSASAGTSGITTLVIDVESNPGPARNGSVAIGDKHLLINQETLTIILSEDSFEITGDTASVNVQIISNGDYTISSQDEWISLSASAGTVGTINLEITVSANPGSTRTGTVSVGYMVINVIQENSTSANYLTMEVLTGGTIYWSRGISSSIATTISYSKDNGETWTSITSGENWGPTINLSAGDTVIFKGTNEGYGTGRGYFRENGYGNLAFNLSGNIMSLIYGDNFFGKKSITSGDTFECLFSGTSVVSAEGLVLPATAFTGSYTYAYMFSGCSKLTSAPLLPAESVPESAYYNMFSNCGSLTTAPRISATSLSRSSCREMFKGCTSLTSAPELMATTIPMYAYCYMFSGCTSLNYIDCEATTFADNTSTSGWTVGVAETGTFIKAASANWSRGTSGIPTGWTVYSNGVIISPSSASTTYSGGSITATATSISAYTVTTTAEWVSLSADSGISGTTVFTITPALNTGSARTASIYFGETLFTLSQAQYVAEVSISPSSGSTEASGGSVTVSATCVGPYDVTTSSDWVTLSASAGTSGTSVFTITASENTGDTRTATVYFGDTVFTLSQAAPAPVYLNNYIYYTTTDGQPLTMNAATWTQNIVSHTYGTIEFDNDVTVIPANAFSGQTTLATITLPSTITSIGASAFRYTSGLTMNFDSRDYPNLSSIGGTVFQNSNLSGCSVYIGSGLTLGTAIFGATNIYSAYSDSDPTGGTASEIGPSLPAIRSIHFGPNKTDIRNVCSNTGNTTLTEIVFEGTTVPSFASTVFRGVATTGTITYPSGSDYSAIIAKLPSGWTAIPV